MSEEVKAAAAPSPADVMNTHLTGVIQGDAQRKSFVAAIHDAITAGVAAGIAKYHEEHTHE